MDIADGKPSNGEDLLVHYALGLPYEGQHGDDLERWVKAYGSFPEDAGPGAGMAPAPPAQNQDEHRWALALADRAIAEAQRRGERLSVAIVDERGDPNSAGSDGGRGNRVGECRRGDRRRRHLPLPQRGAHRSVPRRSGPRPVGRGPPVSDSRRTGGRPIEVGGRVVAAVGIAGPAPGVCAEIAQLVNQNIPE